MKSKAAEAYLVAKCHDDVAQVGEGLVDVLGLLEALSGGARVLQSLTAGQVHKVERACTTQHMNSTHRIHSISTSHTCQSKLTFWEIEKT